MISKFQIRFDFLFFALVKESNSHFQQSLIISVPSMHMYPPPDQQMCERQRYLLSQLSSGYHILTRRYPQPNKFLYRNSIISQTDDMEERLSLVKDLTRELTQMTTLRLLHFFNLIPEFQLLTQHEKTSVLLQNMLAVFMFHGALTYNHQNNTFVDRTTGKIKINKKVFLFFKIFFSSR